LSRPRSSNGPVKAVDPAGQAVSAPEQNQNAHIVAGTGEAGETELREIMPEIDAKCMEEGVERDHVE